MGTSGPVLMRRRSSSLISFCGPFLRTITFAAARPPRGGKEHETDKLSREVQGIIDPVREQAGYRAISDVVYRKHLFLNLLWLPTEAVVNPKVVSDYVFSGISYGVWTHPWNIKAAR